MAVIAGHATVSTEPAPQVAVGPNVKTTEERLKAHDADIASLRKQAADLRAIITKIGKDNKEVPRHARTAADLRQFVKSTEEE